MLQWHLLLGQQLTLCTNRSLRLVAILLRLEILQKRIVFEFTFPSKKISSEVKSRFRKCHNFLVLFTGCNIYLIYCMFYKHLHHLLLACFPARLVQFLSDFVVHRFFKVCSIDFLVISISSNLDFMGALDNFHWRN